jgi:hypothetical protein
MSNSNNRGNRSRGGRGNGRGRARDGRSNQRDIIDPSKRRNYSDFEINLLLDIVKEILPHGQEMWIRVQDQFNASLPAGLGCQPRDSDSLKTKFKQLRNMSKHTGDPDCHETVKRAKRISRDIDNEMAVANLGDEDEYIPPPREVLVPLWTPGVIDNQVSSSDDEALNLGEDLS